MRHSKAGSVTCLSEFSSKETKERVAKVSQSEREGIVVETYLKTNAKGARRHYAKVRWEGSSVESAHEQMRLLLIEKGSCTPTEVVSELRNTRRTLEKVKDKAVSKREKNRVEVKNLNSVQDKDLFTARTDSGFIGCVRTELGIYLTKKEASTALNAANEARRLKSVIERAEDPKRKENETIAEEDRSSINTTEKKKVVYKSRIFTLEETAAMPLLKFKEVWVVVRDEMFVSDCFNKKTKKLVAFTSIRDKAKIFSCHEEAKRTMRVLKGTVGPGFDLKRFFIENK